MAEDCNSLKDFRNFPGITEAWELVKTGVVVIREQMYRLELWHSYSNPDIPYYVSVYVQQDGVWKRMRSRFFRSDWTLIKPCARQWRFFLSASPPEKLEIQFHFGPQEKIVRSSPLVKLL